MRSVLTGAWQPRAVCEGVAVRDDIDRALDDACGLFHARGVGTRARPTRLYVSPDVYEAIVRARAREVERGLPVLVLDLDLEVDPALHGPEVRVA